MAKEKSNERQKQKLVLEQEKAESKNVAKLIQGLEDLKKKGKSVDVQVCPKCKSVRLSRVASQMGDMTGHMGLLPVIYECLDCGWRGRLKILATNKKQSWKEIAFIAEASDIKD